MLPTRFVDSTICQKNKFVCGQDLHLHIFPVMGSILKVKLPHQYFKRTFTAQAEGVEPSHPFRASDLESDYLAIVLEPVLLTIYQ